MPEGQKITSYHAREALTSVTVSVTSALPLEKTQSSRKRKDVWWFRYTSAKACSSVFIFWFASLERVLSRSFFICSKLLLFSNLMI